MRIRREKGLIRLFDTSERLHGEIAYVQTKPTGLALNVEFPSDWHEEARAWIRVGLGLGGFAFSFPWSTVVPDNYQCSGPRYGFYFFADSLVICYGKDRRKHIDMPWAWSHKKHEVLSAPEKHPYRYVLARGEVQEREATIKVERRTWVRWWVPWRMVSTYIDVEFSGEVGERSGSWKGGCIGCSYEMHDGETPVETLRRMERERKF